ncbi:MAG: hypothetical protein HY889_10815, partial [Deltaproteobacteria bacterium]|nr:hypothetical protein [Deltaproteobacteria bacterium]
MKRLINMTITALVMLALGSVNTFALSSGSVREGLLQDSNVESLYSIDDNFTMIAVRNAAVANGSFTVVREFSNGPLRYQIIRHPGVEPFVYKGSAVPSYSTVAMLPNGEFNLAKEGYSAQDLYEHLYAVCRKTNGTASFVIPVKYGQYKRLTKVGAADAFSYILSSKDGNSSWFMACDGALRFVAEKDYSFKGAAETVNIRSNRGLEGVSYIKGGTEAAALAAYRTKAVSAKDEATVLEETALEAAALKTDFVKVHNGIRLEAAYKTAKNGCGSVEIKKTVSSEETAIATVYDYQVCRNTAARLEERAVRPGST